MQSPISFKVSTSSSRKALNERTISRMSSGSRIWSQQWKTSRLARVPEVGGKKSVVLASESSRMSARLKMATPRNFKIRSDGKWIVRGCRGSVKRTSNSKRATSGPIVRGKTEHSILSINRYERRFLIGRIPWSSRASYVGRSIPSLCCWRMSPTCRI